MSSGKINGRVNVLRSAGSQFKCSRCYLRATTIRRDSLDGNRSGCGIRDHHRLTQYLIGPNRTDAQCIRIDPEIHTR